MDISEREIYRIVDANLNRAREGLRVVEELARFVFADRALQNKTKLLRHRLASHFAFSGRGQGKSVSVAAKTEHLNRESLIDLGRDAVTDVGKDFLTRSEARRAALTDLVQSNFARIEESLRALEEFTKFYSRGLPPRLKALRFDVYTLEKEYVSAANRAANALSLKGIGLYPIVDREALGDLDPVRVATQILVPGVRIIQYRDKISSAAEICRICADLRKVTSRKGVIFIVNDRIDIALATGADGVHLGQDDVPVALARRLLGSRKIIGKSTHSLAQARQAAREDIDYSSVGPIFSTATKPGARAVGVELIARVRAMTDKPIIAIGGIAEKNARDVFDKGADGAAVISAILKAENIRAAVLSLTGACRARKNSRR
jgi:thiamine-phosphate pyrophosphorylase